MGTESTQELTLAYMTVLEAAEKWGVSDDMVYKWISQGRVPFEVSSFTDDSVIRYLIPQDAERPPLLQTGRVPDPKKAGRRSRIFRLTDDEHALVRSFIASSRKRRGISS